MSRTEVKVTPQCKAMWPFVSKPYVPKEAKASDSLKYKITAVFDPTDPEHKAFLQSLANDLQEARSKSKDKLANTPWKMEVDKDTGEETGMITVNFKSQYRPTVFDARGNKILGDINVGNGSQVKIAYVTKPYSGLGGGITCYFQALQIIDLVEYNGGEASDFGFEPTDGFSAEDMPPDVPDDAMDHYTNPSNAMGGPVEPPCNPNDDTIPF